MGNVDADRDCQQHARRPSRRRRRRRKYASKCRRPQVHDPSPPLPTGADVLAEQPAEVRQAVARHQAKGRWPSYVTPGYVIYPFNPAATPLVECAPLRTTDIQLAAGETITDVAIGDSERWMATPASSGDPHDPVPHLAVKPQAAGIETNLTIYATKHIYHLLLRSGGHAMQEVEFYYPDELLTAMKDADAAAAKTKQVGSSTRRLNGAARSPTSRRSIRINSTSITPSKDPTCRGGRCVRSTITPTFTSKSVRR